MSGASHHLLERLLSPGYRFATLPCPSRGDLRN